MVNHRGGGGGSVVANQRGAGGRSVVVTTLDMTHQNTADNLTTTTAQMMCTHANKQHKIIAKQN